MAETIRDVSYRGWSGTRGAPAWLVIARLGWRQSFKKRSFWVFSGFAAWYYLVLAAILYFLEQATAATGDDRILGTLLQRTDWKDQFIHGFTFSQLLWLSLALLVGAGSVATDNRSRALVLYLGRPLGRGEYVLGKWLGVWWPLVVGIGLPTAFFFLYGGLNYRDRGFLDDPWLWLRLVGLVVTAAAFHASWIVGISSLFNQARLAGAAYAAVYFVGTFFSNLMLMVWVRSQAGRGRSTSLLGAGAETLHYMSIDGLLAGLAKVVIGTSGTPPVFFPPRSPSIPAPPPGLVWGMLALTALPLVAIAWSRVRAVEVVS